MLEPIVEFFEKLITDFSWKRLWFVLTILVALLLGFWVYESYTAQFRLARIEKEVALLERLSKLLDGTDGLGNEPLKRTFDALTAELEGIVRGSEAGDVLTSGMKKAIASALPWLILAILLLLSPGAFTKQVFLGMAVMAIPFIYLGARLPDFEASWINYWAYPIGHITLIVVVILLWQRRKQRSAERGH
ncbi:MAG: hypothetical protein A3H94_01935 [Acidobacteria bacterium RIFCSPLOWO2_02_FULL_60_20]|nr:MAG: hypothetical protein A3H94_01935 [Acidobacteria bacterium RIFCSPLOWO2_02_FULL_60_20]